MESVSLFIEKKLKLKVNKSKSTVDEPTKRKFLGFSFYHRNNGKVGIMAHKKSKTKIKTKLKESTSRNKGRSIKKMIAEINTRTIGWVNYFGIANIKKFCNETDEWLRRRIRMCIWKKWKRTKTKYENLVKLGIDSHKAWEWANTKKGYWRISNSHILAVTLTNEVISKLGFVSLTQWYKLVYSS